MNPKHRALVAFPLSAAFAASIAVASSHATAPPVGALPSGPTAKIETQKGQLVAIALPEHTGGRVWRIARPFDSKVIQEVREQSDVGGNLVVVFKATGTGSAAISFGLTRGERSKAFESRQFHIQVK
jgi:predicted secreted protein